VRVPTRNIQTQRPEKTTSSEAGPMVEQAL